ncbi:MAG TPA: class I SAM-dependent methyltransferase [Pyrinomonadaceae bacterium]|nr:class I SAM-dependent methyltransferase [Pyrinomonadaceae bacterium]
MLVLTAVCILWLLLFLVFTPLVLLSSLLVRKKTTAADESGSSNQSSGTAANGNEGDAHNFIFDRRRDISKLFGCNTRNVKYRWDIFASKLDHVRRIYDSPVALDFGAGSLRDSFELARLGFCVTAVDLDRSLLESYYKSYDWSSVGCPPKLFTGSFPELRTEARSSFHLAVAFDVIEHLESPDDYCRNINSLLHDRGLLFTIVPNRRSIFERYFKHSLKRQRALGISLAPGVPHLQFKSPEEWRLFFEQCGFRILDHEMAIGFFVNDCWNGLLGLPLRVYVEPVFERLALALGKKFNAVAFEEAFSPHWLMKRVDLVDELFRKWFTGRFGWNLIVAEKQSTNLV